MTQEAPLEQTDAGLVPHGDGWFVVNAADLAWEQLPDNGSWCVFESPDARSDQIGIGIHVLWPGQANGMYHSESVDQEGFLVLSGECLAIVEGQERRLRRWDYLHCPPGTLHITVGAGDGPCAILMVGARHAANEPRYVPDPAAARHGAAVARETHDPREAYADRRGPRTRVPAPWPDPGAQPPVRSPG
jgi:uncharacterized cupin superfamily protein